MIFINYYYVLFVVVVVLFLNRFVLEQITININNNNPLRFVNLIIKILLYNTYSLGISLMAILSGFGSVSSPFNLILTNSLITKQDIYQLEEKLKSNSHLICTKQKKLIIKNQFNNNNSKLLEQEIGLLLLIFIYIYIYNNNTNIY